MTKEIILLASRAKTLMIHDRAYHYTIFIRQNVQKYHLKDYAFLTEFFQGNLN